jgi:protein O-mannosyl-transferase
VNHRQSGPLCNPGFICLLLALATLGVYFPVRHFGFVDYDDSNYFFSNPRVLAGLTWSNVHWAFTSGQYANWHPLTWLSLMLDATLFGPGPGAPHVTNVLLHMANSILLFLLFLRMTGAIWRSGAVAMLFAVHPLHVESVAWISERKDVLSAFFGLLALLCYVRYVELARAWPERNPDRPGKGGNWHASIIDRPWSFYGGALFFFACGLMSKPMLVTLPCVLLLLDFWPLKRFDHLTQLPPQSDLPRQSTATAGAQTGRRILIEKIPFFVLTAAESVITCLTQQKAGATAMLINDPTTRRIANAFVSYSRYLGKTFCPVNLAAPYPHPVGWPVLVVIFSAALFAILCVLAVATKKRFPYLFTGWFWFAGMLVPVIGLAQVGMPAMADRYVYLSLIGILMAIVWGAGELCLKWRLPRNGILLPVTLVFLCCALRARNQTAVWENDGTLFGHAVAVTKNNYIASLNLAFWYSKNGRTQDALKCYDNAMQMSSNDLTAISYSTHTRTQAALYCYYNTLRLIPNDPDELYNIGNAFAKLADWDEAIRDYRRALQIAPDQTDIMNNLGFALAKEKLYAAAATNFLAVLNREPASADAHNNLASVLFAEGEYDQAAMQFRAALQLSPHDPRICINLAGTCLRLAETNQAINLYQQALQLQPDNSQARDQLKRLGVGPAN